MSRDAIGSLMVAIGASLITFVIGYGILSVIPWMQLSWETWVCLIGVVLIVIGIIVATPKRGPSHGDYPGY